MQKNKKHDRPFHLHLEYFSRLKVCLLIVAGLMAITLARGDRDMFATAAEKAGDIGSHMSEERLHPHIHFNILRVATTSSGR